MASGIFKISEKGMTYIPDELRNDGFVGDVDYLANAATVTMLKPGVPLEHALESLEIIQKDIKLRIEMRKLEKDGD